MSANYGRWLYALVVLLVIIAALYLSTWAFTLLRAGSHILALYFMAWLLQFFFSPVVEYLARRRIPRLLAVAYVYLVLALLVVILLVWSVPAIYNQGQRLAQELGNPRTFEGITSATLGIEHFLEQHGVPKQDISNFTRSYSVSLKHGAVQVGGTLQELIKTHLSVANVGASASAFLGFLSTISTLLLDGVIVLVLAFYMTLDGSRVMQRVMNYLPPGAGEVLASVQTIINRKFGGYLRGQAILAASYGLLTYIIAAGFHLQYEIFIAIFAAIMMLIPFVGTYAAIVPPLLGYVLANVTASSFPLAGFLLLLLFLVVSQQVVINLLAPRVFGSAVGMHPILVVLGLLLGTTIAGLWGAIFGVPVFAVILATVDLVYRRIMERRFGFRPPDDVGGKAGPVGGPPAAGASAAGQADTRPAAPAPPLLPRAGAALQAQTPPGESARAH